MKRILFFVMIGLLVGLTGCLKDDDNEAQYYGLGVVQPSGSGMMVLTDDDHLLYGSNISNSEFEAGDRVYFLYTLVREGLDTEAYDYLVKWDDVFDVLTKNIQVLDEVSRDTIGTEGVRINSIWVGKKYLNVDFSFWGNTKTHYFNLVYDQANQTVADALVLEFKHKANADQELNTYRGLISIDLNSREWAGTAPYKIVFKYKDYYSVINDVNISYTPPTAN